MAENGNPKTGNILSPKQARAISSLLTTQDVKAAAQLAGIGYRTLCRWLDDPTFRAGLMRAEGEAIDTATRRLVAEQEKAVSALAEASDQAGQMIGVNIADFIHEEPRIVTIGQGDTRREFYIESASLDWEEIHKRGYLVKKLSFGRYGPTIEIHDPLAAISLKLRAAEAVLNYLLRMRELRTIEERLSALEEAYEKEHRKQT
jgi:hypothetical protein